MRSRLRTLRAGGQRYTWKAVICHIPGRGDCHRGIRLRVWAAGKTSQALEVDLLSTSWPAPWGACATDGAYPAPADVRLLIDHASRDGWNPAGTGTFRLTEAAHGDRVRLPGFLLTDRLVDPDAPDPTARVVQAAGGTPDEPSPS